MFDSVGRDLDEEALARQAKSALLTSILGGAIALAIVAAGMWKIREIQREAPAEVLADLTAEEEAPMEAPPPPPPPPPPPAAAAAEEEQEEETEPEPDEMTEEVEELKEEVKQEMKSDVKPAGQEGGVEGGQVGGVVGGTLGGVEGGVIGGQLGAEGGTPPKVIHHSEIQWKKRIDPAYPVAAQGLGLGEQRCTTTVYFDPEGVPTKVDVDNCPKIFHETVREAMLKSRAYPYKANGQKISTQAKIIFNFKDPE
jgi:hypothetical protein